MDGFGIADNFGIDDGELDGMTPQQCFVLGHELARIAALADQFDEFRRTIHASNRERIEAALEARGRRASFTWPPDDVSEEWMEMVVYPRNSDQTKGCSDD